MKVSYLQNFLIYVYQTKEKEENKVNKFLPNN